MSKILSVLSLSIVLVALFTGCQSVSGIANDTAVALSSEAQRYELLTQTLSKQGEDSAHALKDWAGALAEVNGRLAAIVSKLNKKPEERGKVEARLLELRARLDQLFARPSKIILAAIPSWMMGQAVEQSSRAKATFADLRGNYRSLYSVYPKVEALEIELKVDEAILDTYDDCRRSVQLNLAVRLLGKEDCAPAMQDVCGHQMDLNCVNRVLVFNAGNSCTETVVTGGGETGRERNVEKRVAAWITQELKTGCVSRTPVLRRR